MPYDVPEFSPPTWVQVGNVWLNAEPLRTPDGGYLRLGYDDAAVLAASIGAELPTAADLDALRRVAFVLAPVCLPDQTMLRAAGIAPSNVHAIDAHRNAHMRSAEWCEYHDARVQEQLDAIGWNGAHPVIGAGKHWIAGASRGRARLKGWPLAGGRWIQSGYYVPGAREFHDSTYWDYSSTIVLRRTTAP